MRVSSLSAYVQGVERLVEAWTPRGVDWYVQPWFRGHADSSWPLVPGWYRQSNPSRGPGADYYNEATLLEQFQLRAPIHLERLPTTDWEWLFVMQHYGLRTRLLDWTESSLIALYFALRDNKGGVDAAVWVMNPWWLNAQTYGKYLLFAADDKRAESHAPVRPGRTLKAALPLAITPIRSSIRISAQRGVFTIHGTERGGLDRLARGRGAKRPCMQEIVIPRGHIISIRQELAIAGISESLIFPELEGLCRELKTDFFGE